MKTLLVLPNRFHRTFWNSAYCGNYGILLPCMTLSQKFRQITFFNWKLIVWKSRQKDDYHFYGKITIFSVKSTVLLDKGVTKELISQKFLSVIVFIVCFHTLELFSKLIWRKKIAWQWVLGFFQNALCHVTDQWFFNLLNIQIG